MFACRPSALLLTGCLIGATLAPPLLAEDADTETRVTEQARTLAEMEQRIRALGEDLAGQEAERRILVTELEARERAVAALLLTGRDLERQAAEQTRLAGTLQSRLTEEQAALRAELTTLSGLLRIAHALGQADWLRLVLDQRDPARASRGLSYFAYLNRARLASIDAVRGRAAHLATLTAEAGREQARLIGLAARQADARAELERARDDRAQVLARLEASIAGRTDDLQTLRRDAETLRQIIEDLRQRTQIESEIGIQRAPFAARRGRLPWPVPGARLLAGFDDPRDGDAGRRRDGVLLETRAGQEIHAIHDGRVVHADWLRGFGLLLVLDHGDGFMSFYGHNDALLREPGEWVAAGDPVALSGSSGGLDRPALYFAIREQGRPRDPADWCGEDP